MRKHRLIESIGELEVHESGRLSDGLIATRASQADEYLGTAEELVSAGLARREWFPVEWQPGRRAGTLQRTYETPTGKLTYMPERGLWRLQVAVPQETARQRTEAAWDRWQQQQDAIEEAQQQMTADEAEHLLALRELSPPQRADLIKQARDLAAARPGTAAAMSRIGYEVFQPCG